VPRLSFSPYLPPLDLPSFPTRRSSDLGHCIGDGAVVVDLRLIRSVSVDSDTRTATCGGGALWEDLDPACLRHGLATPGGTFGDRSEEHTSELQSRSDLVCRLLLEKKKK